MEIFEILTIITFVLLLLLLIAPYVKLLPFLMSKKQRIWKWFKNEEKLLSSCPKGENEKFILMVNPNDNLLDDLENAHFQRITIKVSE